MLKKKEYPKKKKKNPFKEKTNMTYVNLVFLQKQLYVIKTVCSFK